MICVFLNNGLFGDLSSRLAAIYILFQLYSENALIDNPFLPILLTYLDRQKLEPVERHFLFQFFLQNANVCTRLRGTA